MVFNKIKWVLAVLLVFFLILATNFIDKNNFNRIKDSIVNIYEDRLLAKGILFDMSMLVNEKYLAVRTQDDSFTVAQNNKLNAQINKLVNEFKTTKLISEEQEIFDELSLNIEEVNALENDSIVNNEVIAEKLDEVKYNLVQLSKIQLEEGKRQMFLGKKAIDSVELLSQIEVYCLIFLAIIIQIIVLSGFKKKKKSS